jgi:hypothetical protein
MTNQAKFLALSLLILPLSIGCAAADDEAAAPGCPAPAVAEAPAPAPNATVEASKPVLKPESLAGTWKFCSAENHVLRIAIRFEGGQLVADDATRTESHGFLRGTFNAETRTWQGDVYGKVSGYDAYGDTSQWWLNLLHVVFSEDGSRFVGTGFNGVGDDKAIMGAREDGTFICPEKF